MKLLLTFAFCLMGTCSVAPSLCADDWKTSDGKIYQNVSVVKAEPDAVTILHQNGGALVPLATLSPDLQKHFNYDPAAAKIAGDARTHADADNARLLQAEMNQASQQKLAKLVAEDPRTPAVDTTSGSSASSLGDYSLNSGPSGYTHHATTDLVDINLRLRDDHPDVDHHSMGSLLFSSHNLRADYSDPNYHTMGNLAASVHSLGPDTSDPNHHTMGQLFGTDPLK